MRKLEHPYNDRMSPQRSLVRLLRRAHAAELAAANAYAGHWRSVRASGVRQEIRAIELEERAHRARLGEMLAELQSGPSAPMELVMACVGWVIAGLCFVGGYFAPMFGAGWIESRNIREYEVLARAARHAGRTGYSEELLGMAEVEWDHEQYFRRKAREHWLARWIPLYAPPSPRETIRARFRDAADSAVRPAA
jgi:rubrerythrin